MTSADPPGRKKIRREPAVLNGPHHYINAMLEADPETVVAAIWERLADQHAATVAYPTLRTYVTTRRAATKTPGTTGPAGLAFRHGEPRP